METGCTRAINARYSSNDRLMCGTVVLRVVKLCEVRYFHDA